MGKKMVKMKRLDALLNDEPENLKEMIMKCFNEIDVLNICKCVRRSLSLLNLNN